MPNNMNVSLDAGAPRGGGIGVGDSNSQNQVSPSPTPTTITWTLTGAIAKANFVPMTAAEPGFSWAYPTPPQGPPAGLFGTPQIGNGGNTLTITDNHVGASTNGTWIYTLRVIFNGVVYATTVSVGPGGTSKNPVIINR